VGVNLVLHYIAQKVKRRSDKIKSQKKPQKNTASAEVRLARRINYA
jgi:hypothetical protein